MYLVDTNVVSAGAPSKTKSRHALVAWMDENSADLYISAVSIAEIEAGIARLRRQGAKRRADDLRLARHPLAPLRRARPAVRGASGAACRRPCRSGAKPGPGTRFADVVIAATATLRGFTILTRNARHFEPLGVPFLDPFVRLPPRRAPPP